MVMAPSLCGQVSERPDLRLKLSSQLGLVQDAVRLLLIMYCQAFRTDFNVLQNNTPTGSANRLGVDSVAQLPFRVLSIALVSITVECGLIKQQQPWSVMIVSCDYNSQRHSDPSLRPLRP